MKKPKANHTLEEILSQPRVWKTGLERYSIQKGDKLPTPSAYEQLVFTGCGSTYYLSIWAARLAEMLYGIPSRAVPASDLIFFQDAWLHQGQHTLLTAVSRSAETSETLRAVEKFNSAGLGDTMAVTCYPDRQLATLCETVIGMSDGQEESIAQTRSFTSMMLGILLWLHEGAPGGVALRLEEAGSRLFRDYSELAEELGSEKGLDRFFFLGSGCFYGLACEAMLKMKEISLSNSEAFHFMEFRHGPKSMVNDRTLLAALLSEESSQQEVAVVREMRQLGARTLVLTDTANRDIEGVSDYLVPLQSSLPSPWRGPLFLPFLQYFALQKAFSKGLNPDKPKNLDAVVVLNV
ncbi:MAG: SIS domain-containing protein [Anaerolineales bacterium]|nr:SIS domain-containing protein [Anaerolineales bacterium]